MDGQARCVPVCSICDCAYRMHFSPSHRSLPRPPHLLQVFHPDKASGAAGLGTEAAHAIFKLLSEAHRVLADAEARRHHDINNLRFKYRRFYSHAGL